MERQIKTILIAGGGTGGHVFPAVSMAEELRRRGVRVHYVGSATGFEARVVPQRAFPFHSIASGAIKNQRLRGIVSSSFKVFLGFLQSLWLLFRLKPSSVIGVGGYVSVPVCLAAAAFRIPLFIQEQNVSVGIANRFLGKFARRVFLGFEQAKECFPPGSTLVTGNPLRAEFLNTGSDSYDSSGNALLILGGSQGANAINHAIVANLDRICERYPQLRIVHQTGERDYLVVKNAYEEIMERSRFEVVPFIDDIVSHYRKASLVIARSGALTVSEILCVRRPAIFVPYPRRGQNDQTANAGYLEQMGVALLVAQGENFGERLWDAIQRCLRSSELLKMVEAFSHLRPSNALATICDHVMR